MDRMPAIENTKNKLLTCGTLIELYWNEVIPASQRTDTVQHPTGADFSDNCTPL
jgi:hypothetical protein